jgi:hypothetical protein
MDTPESMPDSACSALVSTGRSAVNRTGYALPANVSVMTPADGTDAWLTFDLECSLRRMSQGDWIGNEEPASLTTCKHGRRPYWQGARQ